MFVLLLQMTAPFAAAQQPVAQQPVAQQPVAQQPVAQQPVAGRIMERLDRGVVAVPSGKGVFISWRLFSTERQMIGFHVFRQDGERDPKRLTAQPLTAGTNFFDSSGGISDATKYFVRPTIDGIEGNASKAVNVWRKGYLEFPIRLAEGYRAGDCSIADLDGDGQLPSVVMCRGVYGRIVMAAWDWRDSELTQRWVFDSGISYPPFDGVSEYSGMGGHSLSVADVDADGRDEIVYQAMVVDDDGKGLYSTGLRHGDAMHISDMNPERPGLEVFTVQENEEATVRFKTPGAAMRDAATGELLWSHSPGVDVGAGLAADIDPRHPGFEVWGGPGGLRNASGESVGRAPRNTGYAIWWDGDLLRELIDRGGRVTKWDWEAEQERPIFDAPGRGAPRGPNLMGDIIGDWREEIIMASPDGQSLRVYTTSFPTEHRLYTLMHDPQYRLSIAWQNVAYNKPPHTSFFLGHNMAAPPIPAIHIAGE